MLPTVLHTLSCRSGLLVAAALLGCSAAARGDGPEDNARGKISRNFYRIPYSTGTDVVISRDYVNHGVSQGGSSSDAGKIDMNGLGGGPHVLVAAADGEVISVFDSNGDCGCDPAYGGCANAVRIRHTNGEVSNYVHIAQNSASNFGIVVGTLVSRGDPIALEGDVGYTCGGGRAAAAGTCLPSVPPGAGSCGPHLHWEVFRESTGEYVNPMICNVAGSIFADDATYAADFCLFDPRNCAEDTALSGDTFSGFGTFEVVQANGGISADTLVIENLASVVLHAGDRVTLQPGFRVDAEAYFRAEIGPCNDTAPAP